MTTGVVYPRQPEARSARPTPPTSPMPPTTSSASTTCATTCAPAREMAQRGHNFAIVDEVDSILIDEARTPLIISGPSQDRSDLYVSIDKVIPHSSRKSTSRSTRSSAARPSPMRATISRRQAARAGAPARGAEPLRPRKHHHRPPRHERAARAQAVHQGPAIHRARRRGRSGRRIHRPDDAGPAPVDGLHQAIEAKEGCKIQPENVTMASVTFQNYFRLYDKLAGMTGTAPPRPRNSCRSTGSAWWRSRPTGPWPGSTRTTRSTAPARRKYDAIVEAIRVAHEKAGSRCWSAPPPSTSPRC
jgi:preprotein translocase subunit SecA